MLKTLRSVSKRAITGVALVRLDFNTKEEWRIGEAVPTLTYLLRHAGKIVVVSHRGRPRGFDANLTLRDKAAVLTKVTGRKVRFIPHFRFPEIRAEIDRAPKGSVFLLENLRFLRGEGTNDPRLAAKLAGLADFFVNEAFAVSHRANASVVAVTKLLPSYAGLGLEKEIRVLGDVFLRPRRPLVIAVGGGKVEDKLGILRRFRKVADTFLVGGIAANTLLRLKGIDMRDSAVDRSRTCRPMFFEVGAFPNLLLPIDWHWDKDKVLDVGARTAAMYARELAKARTIVWNGPMGFIEDARFTAGTAALARAIARNRKARSIVGGGETVMFLKRAKLDRHFSFVSTGGGAMLEFLAGKKLPGIEALRKRTVRRR